MNQKDVVNLEREHSHYVILKTTCNCNFNCKYCFDKPLKEAYGNQKMSKEVLDHVLKLENEYAVNINLDWFGGEPTTQGQDYYREMFELIPKYYTSNFQHTMQSNGFLPTRDFTWMDLCEDLNICMNFSHDLSTQYLRGDTLEQDKLFELIEAMHERGINGGGIISVLNNNNIHKAIDMYESARTNPLLSPCFNLMITSYNKGQEGLEFSIEEFDTHLGNYVLHVLNDSNPPISYLERASVTHVASLLNMDRYITCDYKECRNSWLNIMPDGKVSCCSRPSAKIVERYNLGNIMDYASIRDLYESPQYKQYVADVEYRYEHECSKCNFFYYCNGLCHTQHSHKYDGCVKYVDRSLCEPFIHNILNAYKWLQTLGINDKINLVFMKELGRYGKFTQTELTYLLHKNGLVSSEFNLFINIDDYFNSPDDFYTNPKHTLFKILNKRLEDEILENLTVRDAMNGTTLLENIEYKESAFDLRLQENLEEIKSLIISIEEGNHNVS